MDAAVDKYREFKFGMWVNHINSQAIVKNHPKKGESHHMTNFIFLGGERRQNHISRQEWLKLE